MRVRETLNEFNVPYDVSQSPELGGSQTGLFVTVPERTTALCRGISLVLLHHDCRPFVRREFLEQIATYLNTSKDEKVWLKRSKYLLAFPLSKYLNCDSPPLPDKPFAFSGMAKKWFGNRVRAHDKDGKRLKAFNRKNTHLFYSWFQCKRCSLPASEEFVQDSYFDHFDSLTKEDDGDEYAISAVFSDPTFDSVLKEIRSKIDSQLDPSIISVRSYASSSACFERTRAQSGQQAQLQEEVGLRSPAQRLPRKIYLDPEDDYTCPRYQRRVSKYLATQRFYDTLLHTTDLYSMFETGGVYTRKGCDRSVQEVRMAIGAELWEDLKELSEIENLSKAPLSCTIQAVLEPFKVRVISKGNALPYYSCKPLQKILWKALSEIRSFTLISRPFSPVDILYLREKANPTDNWFSIDYSAATDGISWKYTSRILRFLLANQSEATQNLALRVLGPHELHYPDREGRVEKWGDQTNGQLMGSILSFPILCLANLGSYLVTMRPYQQGWTRDEILNHVLVNGDDMVYAAPRDLWDRHVKVAGDLGLKMSVGKAYRHPTYLNINSTSVHSPLYLPHSVHEIPYLPVGLFYGQHKVQGRSDAKENDHHSDASGVFANANNVVDGALPNKRCEILKMYIATHKEEMVKKSKVWLTYLKGGRRHVQRNWFIPISGGGMGIKPPDGWSYSIERVHRTIWKNIAQYQYGGLGFSSQLPQPGYYLDDLEELKEVPWCKKDASEQEEFETMTICTSSYCLRVQAKYGIYHFSPRKGCFKN